jgi:hypothetical protein
LLEILDPFADDEAARAAFQQAEAATRRRRRSSRYVYVPAGAGPDAEDRLREELKPERVISG